MKHKRILVAILLVLIILLVGINAYFYIGNQKSQEISNGKFGLCYYLTPLACIPEIGNCGMGWSLSSYKNPNPCKIDSDCLSSAPSESRSLKKVDCREDNRKGCLKDSDCVPAGTCCYITTCYNKDYWENYNKSTCEGKCDEIKKDPAYPFESCKCINNYCEELDKNNLIIPHY